MIPGRTSGPRQPLTAYSKFELYLNQTTGTWSFYVDGFLTGSVIDTNWIGLNGDQLTISGEILHHETDMYGIASNPMKIRNLAWSNGTGWYSLIPDDFIYYGDGGGTEWRSDTSYAENAILIYDLKPLQ